MIGSDWRPRRSCLYVPADKERALAKLPSLKADCFILDLEDAVAPEAKDVARDGAAALLQSGALAGRDVLVRLNGFETEWGVEDFMVICALGPRGVVAPKVSSGVELVELDDALTGAGLPEDAELWANIETPLGVLNVAEIAAASRATRLSGLVLGLNDLAAATGAQAGADRAAFAYAMSALVTAARAYGLTAIDAVFNDFRDGAGLERECVQGCAFGFDGKALIHPDQIAPANQMFVPSQREVEGARAIVAAFAAAGEGVGVVAVGGRMVERLHLAQAERVLARADAIAAQPT